MLIREAQREMRSAFLGGFMGQIVSAVLWAVAAALATRGGQGTSIVFLVVAGVFVFPLTQLGLRIIGRPGRVKPGNDLYAPGAQVAFVLPLSLPVVGAATLYRTEWFFPSFMVVLGAHYVPFVFLYGMRMFAALAALLWTGGLALGLWIDAPLRDGSVVHHDDSDSVCGAGSPADSCGGSHGTVIRLRVPSAASMPCGMTRAAAAS